MGFSYKTLKQVVEDENYPFTMGQLRFFINNRKDNGLEKSIRKIGKRLYFRMDLFSDWVDKHLE